jgi:hypothetical protein
MTLILSGTDGLSDIDGSAATPAIRGTDANTGIFFPAADTIAFAEGGAEVMRIDSDGDVGIGTTTPNSKLTSQTASTSTSVFSFANQLNNSYASNDSISALGFHVRADVNATGVGGAIAFSGGGTSDGSGNLIFCIKPTGNIATVVAPSNEKMRIDSSGNVGLGTSSPAVKLDINGITGWGGGTTGQTAQIVGASSGIANGGNFRVLSNTTQAADVGGALTLGGYYTSTTNSIDFGAILGAKENSTSGNTAGYLAFGTRPNAGNMTERMRIDSGGFTYINCTSSVASVPSYSNILFNGVAYFGISIKTSLASAGSTFAAFVNSAGTTQGSIYANATNTVQFLTSSDYRLKENIAPMTGALAKVSALKPVTYNWKVDGSSSQGFIAHELAEVSPECVGGEKDAVDANGNPKYQGVDTSFLVATLTAAIQEQQTLITALTARITALETQNADNPPQGETP